MSKGAAVLLCLVCGGTAWAQTAPRRALLVGSRLGEAGQPTLRHTGTDVGRMASVLKELSGFGSSNVSTLDAMSATEVLEQLHAFAARPEKAGLFLFYYSGHGDSGGLQLHGSELSLDVLLAEVRKVPAELRIVLLDACQSGAATRGKGVVPGPPVEVRIDSSPPLGEVIITSSSADEESFESDALGGAIFTLQWVSGLRGAADEDKDGAVTLSEAYRYAYVHTVSTTLLSSRGPQRPTFKWDLQGQREPVLASLGLSSRLTLLASRDARFFVFDSTEEQVLAEVFTKAGEPARVMLAPGRYVVRERSAQALKTAQIELGTNDDRVLDDRKMIAAPLVHLARKGGLGQWYLSATAGQLATTLGPIGLLQTSVGAELERGPLLWRLSGRFVTGADRQEELLVREAGGGVQADAMFGLTFGAAVLRGGPAVGLLAMRQQVTGRPRQGGVLAVLGASARLEVALSSEIALLISGAVESWWGAARGPYAPGSMALGPGAGVFLNGSWGAGVRAAF